MSVDPEPYSSKEEGAAPPTNILAIAANARAAAGEQVPPESPTDPAAWLIELARQLREAPGIARKQPIGALVVAGLPDPGKLTLPGLVTAWKGEDSAALDLGRIAELAGQDGEGQTLPEATGHILVAADGIRPDLMVADPYWAGFCSVIVNVNDILAMGGRPLALVQVVSYSDPDQGRALTRGLGAAAAAYGVPVIGGHTHPPAPAQTQAQVEDPGSKVKSEGDAENDEDEVREVHDEKEDKEKDEEITRAVGGTEKTGEGHTVDPAAPVAPVDPPHLSVTALGVAGPGLLRSDAVQAGDTLVIAVDLRGDFRPSLSDDSHIKESRGGRAFDTIAERSAPELERLCQLPMGIARNKLANACKDISNPGLIGTLGMLCESSGVGALVDALPRPPGVEGPPELPAPGASEDDDSGPTPAPTALAAPASQATPAAPAGRPGPAGPATFAAAAASHSGPVGSITAVPGSRTGNTPLLDWLLAYPGYGFLFAAPPDRAEALCALFAAEGVTAVVCGHFTPVRKLQLALGSDRVPVWDFGAGDTITGLGPRP